jgi:hypothetical protein
LCIAEGTAPPDALAINYRVDVRGLWDDLDDALGQYSGVWLADGLTSCGASRLSYALTRMTGCLRSGGVLYMANRHGSANRESRMAKPREMTREALQGLITRLPGVHIVDVWTTPVSPLRWLFGAGPAWLHALCVVGATTPARQPRLVQMFPAAIGFREACRACTLLQPQATPEVGVRENLVAA